MPKRKHTRKRARRKPAAPPSKGPTPHLFTAAYEAGPDYAHDAAFLARLKAQLPELRATLANVQDHWAYEDGLYRYYHRSYKVYRLQNLTEEIVLALRAVMPDRQLNDDFGYIVRRGTGKKWVAEHNKRWHQHAGAIVEAFLHAKYFLEMAVKYGEELVKPVQPMPSGWASLMYLYNARHGWRPMEEQVVEHTRRLRRFEKGVSADAMKARLAKRLPSER